MSYSELIQAYFERSVALQWYWTIFVLVIGGVLGFSTFRLKPELVTTILVSILFACFAYKNLGAIVATAEERESILSAIKSYPVSGSHSADIERTRLKLEPTIPEYDIGGVRIFHVFCALLTIAFLWVKEWRRRKPETSERGALAALAP
jgi:hypothetical protein